MIIPMSKTFKNALIPLHTSTESGRKWKCENVPFTVLCILFCTTEIFKGYAAAIAGARHMG